MIRRLRDINPNKVRIPVSIFKGEARPPKGTRASLNNIFPSLAQETSVPFQENHTSGKGKKPNISRTQNITIHAVSVRLMGAT